jgi:hypothetical protein
MEVSLWPICGKYGPAGAHRPAGPHRGPDPGPDLAGTPEPGPGRSGARAALKMSTGSQRSSSSQLKHRIRFRCRGSGRSGPETGLRSGLARARGMDRDGRAALTKRCSEPRPAPMPNSQRGAELTRCAGLKSRCFATWQVARYDFVAIFQITRPTSQDCAIFIFDCRANVAPMPSTNPARFTVLLVAIRQRSNARSFH